ncbi:DUF6843 domain-containing protein [Filimonas effusa]|uniref:DUF6843 domain-containing protein n=1 Tax=Filimonas effusa TaxID=2508721 RepID=A0A4Q1DA97_9BACT|nr:hypothetical protein [Filimonas effusa]RXK85818.1 hypothetical protein ESB13_03125 [Filimonas effusa]
MRAVISFFILSLMLSSCGNSGEQEIIVVPKNFKGYIIIIFNQKSGMSIKYEGKKRVYEIPPNGILKTQFAGNYGWREFAEYYYEKIIPENKLSSYAEIKKVPTDTIVGFMGATGTVKKSTESEERLEFIEFYIGTKSDIEQAQKQAAKLDIVKITE